MLLMVVEIEILLFYPLLKLGKPSWDENCAAINAETINQFIHVKEENHQLS